MTMRDANFPRNFKHSVGNIGKEFFVVLQTADAIYRKIFRLYFEILTFNYNFNILVPIDADFTNDFNATFISIFLLAMYLLLTLPRT